MLDKKELNKIFKREHSAVSRNCQLKIFCGKPGSEDPGLGGGAGAGLPLPAEGRLDGAPAGQRSGLGAGPNLWTWILPETALAAALPQAKQLMRLSEPDCSPPRPAAPVSPLGLSD